MHYFVMYRRNEERIKTYLEYLNMLTRRFKLHERVIIGTSKKLVQIVLSKNNLE